MMFYEELVEYVSEKKRTDSIMVNERGYQKTLDAAYQLSATLSGITSYHHSVDNTWRSRSEFSDYDIKNLIDTTDSVTYIKYLVSVPYNQEKFDKMNQLCVINRDYRGCKFMLLREDEKAQFPDIKIMMSLFVENMETFEKLKNHYEFQGAKLHNSFYRKIYFPKNVTISVDSIVDINLVKMFGCKLATVMISVNDVDQLDEIYPLVSQFKLVN